MDVFKSSTSTKRSASPSLDEPPPKRTSASSEPEEGELDDHDAPLPPHRSPDRHPRPPSPSSAGKFDSKIKYPFKPKPLPQSSDHRSSSRFDDRKPLQQYDRAPDDDHRRDRPKFRDHRPQDGPPPRRRMDSWVPDERMWERDRRPPHPRWDVSRDRDRDRHAYDSRPYRPPPPHPSMPPNAPRDDHSPSPLPLPTAREDVQLAREKRPVAGAEERAGQNSESGTLAAPVGKKKREPVERSRKEEMEAYGRTFEGCGKQSDYDVTTKLGEGTFGEVHKAVQSSTGRAVALKRILMHNEKEGMPVTALREIKILKAMKHPNVVDIVDMFVVRSKGKENPLSVYMVFPYMDHDLAGLLENERVKLQPSQIKLYMKQLLEGTEYMHRNHILHRDMKAANLLISNSGALRIADFGLARAFDPSIVLPSTDSQGKGGKYTDGKEKRYTNCVVTRWYRPPELLLGARQYGGEVDIWGIGCVLGEMFMRKPILPGTSDIDQLEKIWQLCGTPNQHTWPNFDALPGCEGVKRFQNYPKKLKSTFLSICIGPETCDLLDKLLTCNPRDRITASQALDHDYFWTDPLPADPKTLPAYEASHEFDKRGRRNNLPPPQHPHQPPEYVRPALQHGQGFYGHPQPGHGRGHGRPSRGGQPPPPVMLTALMQQAQGPSGTGMPGGYGPPPPVGFGPPGHGAGMPPMNGFGPPPPQGYPPPSPLYGHGHGRYQPYLWDRDRGEREERGGGPRLHPSLPIRPVGLPPKPTAPLGAGGSRHDREKDRDRELDRERDRERGRDRERERGRYGAPRAGGGDGHGGNGSDSGGFSGGLPYS